MNAVIMKVMCRTYQSRFFVAVAIINIVKCVCQQSTLYVV